MLYEGKDLQSDEMKDMLWDEFENQAKIYDHIRDDAYPATISMDRVYNPQQLQWYPRGFSGMDHNTRMKEMFVELEYQIEEVIGKPRKENKEVHAYKGQPKKWQILDDDCFDRDQIEKLQASANAPLPEQLEQWKEKHSKPLPLPVTNETIRQWRDEPTATDQVDFDPKLLAQARTQTEKLYLDRYEKPAEITE